MTHPKNKSNNGHNHLKIKRVDFNKYNNNKIKVQASVKNKLCFRKIIAKKGRKKEIFHMFIKKVDLYSSHFFFGNLSLLKNLKNWMS